MFLKIFKIYTLQFTVFISKMISLDWAFFLSNNWKFVCTFLKLMQIPFLFSSIKMDLTHFCKITILTFLKFD